MCHGSSVCCLYSCIHHPSNLALIVTLSDTVLVLVSRNSCGKLFSLDSDWSSRDFRRGFAPAFDGILWHTLEMFPHVFERTLETAVRRSLTKKLQWRVGHLFFLFIDIWNRLDISEYRSLRCPNPSQRARLGVRDDGPSTNSTIGSGSTLKTDNIRETLAYALYVQKHWRKIRKMPNILKSNIFRPFFAICSHLNSYDTQQIHAVYLQYIYTISLYNATSAKILPDHFPAPEAPRPSAVADARWARWVQRKRTAEPGVLSLCVRNLSK